MFGAERVSDLAAALTAARHLASQYDSVVVTNGGHGLAAWTLDGKQILLPARKVVVSSTHGAGDCFTGTLAFSLAHGSTLEIACHVAAEAPATHVEGVGKDSAE